MIASSPLSPAQCSSVYVTDIQFAILLLIFSETPICNNGLSKFIDGRVHVRNSKVPLHQGASPTTTLGTGLFPTAGCLVSLYYQYAL